MVQENSRPTTERRGKKPNWYSRIATIIATAGWLCAVVSLVLIDRAQPPGETMFTHMMGGGQRFVGWDGNLLRISLIALIASLVACGLGLLLSNLRMKRKSDRQNKLLISLSIVSVLLTVIFLVFFAQYL